ncbi:MAG: DNA topoisomerase I, partial [Saprospiraceae bacterium]|nr:DNA topoisomerase I [Saprospiraceae bacterium]
VIQIGDRDELDEDEKPKFANLKPGQSLETITFEEAMDLFQLPKTLGTWEGSEVTVASGRYGPYIKYNDLFINLPKAKDPMQLEMNEAIVMIKEKISETAPFGHYQGMPITKGNGRFGPFVKWNDMFISIPARYKLDTITEAQAIEIIEIKIEKEANRYIQNWPAEKISLENGRWGPYIKFGKLNFKIPKVDGVTLQAEQLRNVSLDEVKKWIEAEAPSAFNASKPKPTAAKSKK